MRTFWIAGAGSLAVVILGVTWLAIRGRTNSTAPARPDSELIVAERPRTDPVLTKAGSQIDSRSSVQSRASVSQTPEPRPHPSSKVNLNLISSFPGFVKDFHEHANLTTAGFLTPAAIAIIMQAEGRTKPVKPGFRCPPVGLGADEDYFLQNSDVYIFKTSEFPAKRKLDVMNGLYKPLDPHSGVVDGLPPTTLLDDELKAEIEKLIQRAQAVLDA